MAGVSEQPFTKFAFTVAFPDSDMVVAGLLGATIVALAAGEALQPLKI
jgi:hypothetical protein